MSVIGTIGEGLVELTPAASRSLNVHFGGDAANIAVMAARLGAGSRIGGRVGTDTLGDQLVEFWRRQGVDTSGVLRDADASTGLYLNEPALGGGHRFTYWRIGSAGSRLRPGDLEQAFFDDLAILVVTGVTLAVSATSAAASAEALRRARAAGARIVCVLNHRPALGGTPSQLAELARLSDVLIASTDDIRPVFGLEEAAELRALLSPGPAELVVSDGSLPAVVATAEAVVHQPVPRVRVENAAGAGDALAGAYLAARLRGLPPETALGWGVAAASLSVQQDGCASSFPSAEDTLAAAAQLAPAVRPSELST